MRNTEGEKSCPYRPGTTFRAGDFYPSENPQTEEEEEEAPPVNVLPRNFKLVRDQEWEQQVAAIQSLFAEDDEGPSQEDLFEEGTSLSVEDVRQMHKEISESIAERGPDRIRCVLNLLFENHLTHVDAAPTWKELWTTCWTEPLTTLRGGDVQPSAKVRQTIYRLREIMNHYFETEAGQRWPSRAVIAPNEYRLQFPPQSSADELPDSPFIDSAFPEAPLDETDDE